MSDDQLRLGLQASAPAALDGDANWPDVLQRAAAVPAPQRRRARRGRVPGGLALALVLGGAAALGAPQVTRLLSAQKVSPTVTRVEKTLRTRPVGQRLGGVGFTARIVPGSTHLVLSIPLADGGRARLYVARSARGLPCFATTGIPFGRSGCQLPTDPRLLWVRWGLWLNRSATVVGHASQAAARSVEIVYRGGSRQVIRPLERGWFMAQVPRGRRPLAVLARAADGRVLTRTPVHVRFGPGPPSRVPLPRRQAHIVPLPVGSAFRISPIGVGRAVEVGPIRRAGRSCVLLRILGAGVRSERCFAPVRGRDLRVARLARGPYRVLFGTTGLGVAFVVVRFADGDGTRPVTASGRYAVALPAWRWRGRHRVVAVVGLDRHGRVVARRPIPPA